MKIRSISIQGFRGFNEEHTIDFHDRLTLIYAPNSYGKTSISEAFEWLLYGITSKVEKADSKDEYKGSYRNTHLPTSLTPFVKAIFTEGTSKIEFRGELVENDFIKRLVNGGEVDRWPLSHDLSSVPKPFILQHALKYLLLVRPDERFQGFARLLGFEELDQIQKNIVSLCTKPDAAIPAEVKQLINDIKALEVRVVSQSSLDNIHRVLKKGEAGLEEANKAITDECRRRVPPNTDDKSVFPQLLKIREESVSKIFKGRITLVDYSAIEKQSNSEDEKFFLGFVIEDFIKKYSDLIALTTVQYLLDRAQFFDLGTKFLTTEPGKCPFCSQTINETILQHISDEHKNLTREKELNIVLEKQRSEIQRSLNELRTKLNMFQARHIGKVKALLALEPSLSELKTILVPKHQTHFMVVETAILQLGSTKQKLESLFNSVITTLDKVEKSIHESKEDIDLIKYLGMVLIEYVKYTSSFIQLISNNVLAVSEVTRFLNMN